MANVLWMLGGLVVAGFGVKLVLSSVVLLFGGHPEVAVGRHFGRGLTFLALGAVVVVAVVQVGGL